MVTVLTVLLTVTAFVTMFGMLLGLLEAVGDSFAAHAPSGQVNEFGEMSLLFFAAALLLALLLAGAGIWFVVLRCMALYDVFHSADPDHGALLLLISIVWSVLGLGIVRSILLFANRNGERGMPPRQDSSDLPEIGIAPEENSCYNGPITN